MIQTNFRLSFFILFCFIWILFIKKKKEKQNLFLKTTWTWNSSSKATYKYLIICFSQFENIFLEIEKYVWSKFHSTASSHFICDVLLFIFVKIRNVSWLLLGSVIPRSLELNNNGPNAIHFFRQFPSLFDFFCQRLRGCDRSQLKNQSSVFAVLLILASLQPPNECDFGDGTHNSLVSIITFVLPKWESFCNLTVNYEM